MAQLDQAVVVQSEPWDTAFARRLDQGPGARAQCPPLGGANEFVALFREVEILGSKVFFDEVFGNR